MSNLKHWQDKIKEKRKNTDFRDFIKELGSWYPIVFNKNSGMISRYPESSRIKICTEKEFEESRDDLINNGLDYNLEEKFLDVFGELFKKINHPPFIIYGNNENATYCDAPANVNNVYLSSVVVLGSENIFYSYIVRTNVVNCFNSVYVVEGSENIYFSLGIVSSYNIFYSSYLKNCNNIWFSSNLTGCKECLFCSDLDNSSYYIENKQYSKEEYFIRKELILKEKDKFQEYYNKVSKIGNNHGGSNISGNFLLDCEDVSNSSFVYNTKNANNAFFAGTENGNTNIFDSITVGAGHGADLYGAINSGGYVENLYSVAHCGWSNNSYYSFLIENCSYCIGCIGLKNKSYCILNKQYTKQEWEILADTIFSQMDKQGVLGDFFPSNINPFYFNDTMAGILGNFTKEEIKKDGYMWRDEKIKVDIPKNAEIIHSTTSVGYENLRTSQNTLQKGQKILSDYQGYNPNGEWKINPEILKKVIVDSNGNYYKIVKTEYDFLLKHGLPLPEMHWSNRMKINLGV